MTSASPLEVVPTRRPRWPSWRRSHDASERARGVREALVRSEEIVADGLARVPASSWDACVDGHPAAYVDADRTRRAAALGPSGEAVDP